MKSDASIAKIGQNRDLNRRQDSYMLEEFLKCQMESVSELSMNVQLGNRTFTAETVR